MKISLIDQIPLFPHGKIFALPYQILFMKPPLLLLFAAFFILKSAHAQKLAALPYANGIANPIFLTHCGDERLFVLTRDGTIRIINPDGTVRPTLFLDISAKISSYTNSEEGLLGLAFSPDYATDGKFYVDYTSNEGGQLHSVIEEYKVSSDPNVADPSSALIILTQAQPYANHNGGNLMFGSDGYLYINFGDGGSGGDPQGNGQDVTTYLGKMLRIDVSNSSQGTPYVIPSSNPFYNSAAPGIKKEIWAYGLRNPWRSSFDRLTHDLWIADVGQGAVEEIDFAAASDAGGHNYGWNTMEGDQCYSPSTGCNTAGLTMPIYTYTHSYGHSITGGYVWRSAQSKSLFGLYIFSDYISKWIDGIREVNGNLDGPVQHLIPAASVQGNPVSFGEDVYGDLYILFNNNSTIYRLTDTSYLHAPKAFFTATDQGGGNYLFEALQGRNLSYQWMRDGVPIDGETNPSYTTSIPGSYTLEVTNSIGNSDISDAFMLGVVPVTLASFDVKKSGSVAQLIWTTASASNLKGFSVERKLAADNEFSEIGFVSSKSDAGNSFTALKYSFVDKEPVRGETNFYRLKILDLDGRHVYSAIRSVQWPQAGEIYIYPNPANGYVTIHTPPDRKAAFVKVFNAKGQLFIQEKISSPSMKLSLQNIKGLFFLQVSDATGEVLYRTKLMVH